MNLSFSFDNSYRLRQTGWSGIGREKHGKPHAAREILLDTMDLSSWVEYQRLCPESFDPTAPETVRPSDAPPQTT